MDELSVQGAFMITIGHGAGPEVVAFVSACQSDGTPVDMNPGGDPPVEFFTGLTAMFGSSSFPCKIVDVQSTFPPPPGFLGRTLENTFSDLPKLAGLGLGALGVVVDTGSGRGEGVIGPVGAATPQQWWQEQQQDPPKR